MKAASQQRRTLSFKDGLLEIKKSMGLGTGQPTEEQAQSPQGRHASKGNRAGAKSEPQNGAQGQRRAQGAPGHKGHKAPKGPQGAQGHKGPRSGGGAGEGRARPQQQRSQAQGKPAGEGAGAAEKGHEARGQQSRPARGPRGPHDGERGGQRKRPAREQQSMANLSEAEKARIERNRQLNAVWNVFAKHYRAFRERLPLKIGVVEDLVARHPDYERTLIVAVLKRHVNHPRYHERVAVGGSRYELDGSVSEGPGIDPSHVGRAKAALAHQKAKAEARAKEQENAQQAAQAGQAAAAPAAADAGTPAQDPAAAAPQPAVEAVEPAPAQAPEAAGETPESHGEAPATHS
ncbi:ProQ/FINO family protein [Paraburkholderia sacchari]|uniref:ProQ/FINO family protein n=1 Tax=Paraburkholderia sacchari TaxID=159450 RepID=UPI001BD0FCC8|nr:ProQ/FINO family protein [Paraburkholderia sacchari]